MKVNQRFMAKQSTVNRSFENEDELLQFLIVYHYNCDINDVAVFMGECIHLSFLPCDIKTMFFEFYSTE